MKINESLQQIRKVRGLSLGDAVGRQMSATTLSRFENGQLDLKYDRLFNFIRYMGLFSYEITEQVLPEMNNFPHVANTILHGAKTYQEAEEIYAWFELNATHHAPTLLIVELIILRSDIRSRFDVSYQRMNPTDAQVLLEFYTRRSQWAVFEYNTFPDVAPYLAFEAMYQAFIGIQHPHHLHDRYAQQSVYNYLTVIELAIMNHRCSEAERLVQVLNQVELNPHNVQLNARRTAVNRVLQYLITATDRNRAQVLAMVPVLKQYKVEAALNLIEIMLALDSTETGLS